MARSDNNLVPVQDLYDAFFALIESDEWDTWDEYETAEDLNQIALAAIPWFKFPRCSLEWDAEAEYFLDPNITNVEIQVIALFMKALWYGRVIDSWENLRPLYTERDFSPAKQLGEFRQRQDAQMKAAKDLEKVYYRSINYNPFDYKKFAGG